MTLPSIPPSCSRPVPALVRGALVLMLAGGLAACSSLPPPVAPPTSGLPPAVAQAMQCARLPAESLAYMVLPLQPPAAGQPRPMLSHQADRSMQPASTMKLVTSVVALSQLGASRRGHTELLTAAAQQGDVLQGDLVLKGGADPELGLAQVWQLLAELRWQGVREIAGDIVLDRSLFRPERLDLGQPAFDETPEFPYNVIPDALGLAGQLSGLVLRSDATQVEARLLPPLPGVEIDNQLGLNERACRDWDDDWRTPVTEPLPDGRLRLRLQGSYPRHCLQRPALQLFDRDLQAARQLRLVWEGLGGVWRGGLRSGSTPAGARRIARHDARPWGELLRPLNKQSDNVLARLLYLSLGVAEQARPDTPEALRTQPTLVLADHAVRRWFAEHQIDTTGLVMDNGSGLSRSERISARQLVELLRVSLNSPQAPDLMMSLPVAGEDGSMRNRLKTSPAAGQARFKTGSLRNVVSVAGYVPDDEGRVWMVAAMINHEAAGRGRPALDTLIDWVARTGLGAAGWQETPAACAPAR